MPNSYTDIPKFLAREILGGQCNEANSKWKGKKGNEMSKYMKSEEKHNCSYFASWKFVESIVNLVGVGFGTNGA